MRALNLPIKNKDEFLTCEADVFRLSFLTERKISVLHKDPVRTAL